MNWGDTAVENTKKVHITYIQLVATNVSILVGVGVLSLPRIAAEVGKQCGWIIVLIGMAAPLLSTLLISLLFKRFPGSNFYEISHVLLGKYLGKLPVIVYILYSLVFIAIIVRIFDEILNIYLLPNTPEFIKISIILITAAYLVMGGVKVVARLNELLFYMLFTLLIFSLPAVKEFDWTFIQPLFSISPSEVLKGSLKTAFAYVGLEYLMVLYPFAEDRKKVPRSAILATAITASIYLYSTIICLLIFGPYAIKNMYWPVLVLMKTVEVPVIERLEFYFIPLYIMIAFRPIMNQYFACSYLTAQLFGIKEFRKVTPFILPVVLFIALYPPNIDEAIQYTDIVGFAGLFIGIILPAILLLVAVIFKRKAGKCDVKEG